MNTPITLIYAAISGLMLFVFAVRVIKGRVQYKVDIGDGGKDEMIKLIRIHGNSAEYIPIILILLFLLEHNKANPFILHAIGVALILGRVIFAYGISQTVGTSIARKIGMILTFLAMIIGSLTALYCVM